MAVQHNNNAPAGAGATMCQTTVLDVFDSATEMKFGVVWSHPQNERWLGKFILFNYNSPEQFTLTCIHAHRQKGLLPRQDHGGGVAYKDVERYVQQICRLPGTMRAGGTEDALVVWCVRYYLTHGSMAGMPTSVNVKQIRMSFYGDDDSDNE